MRVTVDVQVNGKWEPVEFDHEPSEADIDDAATYFKSQAPSRPAAPARPRITNGDPLGDPALTGERTVVDPPSRSAIRRPVVSSQLAAASLLAGDPSMLTRPQQAKNPAARKDPVGEALDRTVAKSKEKKPVVVWNGTRWNGDPFEGLPFTRQAFQAAVNEPNRGVPTKNGKALSYTQAAAIVSRKTGQRDFKADRSTSDIEAAQIEGLSPNNDVGTRKGFTKGQTDKQVPRGAAAKATYDKANFVGGRKITAAEKSIKALDEVKASAKKAGVPGIVADVALSPIDTGIDFRRAFDPAEPADKRMGAALNVLVAAATSEVGGRVLSKATAAERKALAESFKASKVGKAVFGAGDRSEAINAAMSGLNLPQKEAEKVVAAVEKETPVKWANSFDAQGKPVVKSTERPKPQSVADQRPKVEAKTPIAEPVRPVETPKPTGETAGLSVAQRTKEAETLGTAKPQAVKQLTDAEAHAKGKAAVEAGQDPYALVKSLSEGKRPATKEEYGAIQEGRRRLLQDINRTRSARDAAVGTPEHTAASEAYDAALAKSADFDGHLDNVKGATGGSLQSLKIGSTIDEGDFAAVRQEARGKKGKELTPKEDARLKELVDAHNAEIERINKAHAAELDSLAQKNVVKSRVRSGRTVEQIKASRVETTDRLKTKWAEKSKELASTANATLPGVPLAAKVVHVAPEIIQLAKDLGEEGVIKLSEVVERVRATAKDVGVDLSEEDVKRVLAGDYEKPKQPISRTQGQQQLKVWRQELSDAKRLEAKIKADADRQTRQEAQAAARGELRDARAAGRKEAQEARAKTKAEYEKVFGERSRLENSIGELERRLRDGDLAGKPKPERSPELERMYQKRDYLKSQIKREIESKKPKTTAQKVGGFVADVANVPRTLKTSFDLSAALRQGMILTVGHPGKAANAFKLQLAAFRDPVRSHAINAAILEGPNAPLYRKAGLYLSDSESSLVSQHEEAFLSKVAGNIPLVKRSERAYTTYLNVMRASVFDGLTNGGNMAEADLKAIANFINVATGRGSLGKFEHSANGLATVLFSPRYLTSRFQLLAGQPLYAGGSAKAKTLIAGEMAKYVGAIAGLWAIVKANGGEVNMDTTSSDFGKIKIGITRIDTMAGLQQALVIASRVAQGKRTSASGNVTDLANPGFGGDDRLDQLVQFGRSKLAPTPGYVVNYLKGRDGAGKPFSGSGTIKDIFTPLIVNDFYESMQAQGIPKGIGLGILSGLGLSINNQFPRGSEPPELLDAIAAKATGRS